MLRAGRVVDIRGRPSVHVERRYRDAMMHQIFDDGPQRVSGKVGCHCGVDLLPCDNRHGARAREYGDLLGQFQDTFGLDRASTCSQSLSDISIIRSARLRFSRSVLLMIESAPALIGIKLVITKHHSLVD
jgi:hypothetical protein